MSELPAVQDLDLPIANLPEAKIDKMSERKFLPYVRLIGTSSKEAEDSSVNPGNFVLMRDTNTRVMLTSSFEALVVALRSVACRKTEKSLLRYYDMESAEYKKIEEESRIPGQMGAWHGPEFLIWVRSLRTWATFHCSSETARGRSADLITILKTWANARAAKKRAILEAGDDPAKLEVAQGIVVANPQVTFKCGLVKYQRVNKSQWAPQFVPNTTPFSEVPPFEEVREYSLQFQNPPKTEKETVQAGEGATETRG